ncbi:MAG: alpha/beta hydrolase fold domain-containing protein [Stenotrophobium sp.]
MLLSFPRILCVLAAVLALAGCSQQQVLNSLTTDTGYSVVSNIPFSYEHPLLGLDVYTPTNVQNAPVIVFFYGGRWSSGSKDAYKFVGQALTSQGFVSVIADYRKYPQVRFPEFVKDGARAVQWTHDNIRQYGGDPAKLFVMGHDAGAYIAAMLALNDSYLQAVGGSRSWLRGMIGLAGPYDFMPIIAPDLRDMFGPPEQFAQSQPIMFVDGHNPPLLLMTGLDDDSVLAKNTQALAKSVASAGGPVETVYYPKLSHSMILATLAAPLRKNSDVLANIVDFVHRRENPAPASANAAPPPENIQVQPLQLMPSDDIAPAPVVTPQPSPSQAPNPSTPAPVPVPP